jgi:Outer membrane protein beta-barrel domain
MRRKLATATVPALVLFLSSAAAAQNRGEGGQFGSRPPREAAAHVEGFGGMTFGDTTPASTFGGGVGIPLTNSIHIVAEGGRLSNLNPELLETVLDFTPVDFRLSAWYGEAGVRFLVPTQSAVRPYAEATAGFARLKPGLDGIAGTPGVLLDAALSFLDRTEPMLGLGGGVIVQGGPIVLDLGYRYKKIMADGTVQSLLSGGDALDVSQARIGVGVRF